MVGIIRAFPFKSWLTFFVVLLGVAGCSASAPPKRPVLAEPSRPTPPLVMPTVSVAPDPTPAQTAQPYPVMLGIDVLEARGFDAVKGKRIGLLTHPAGVKRQGISTVDVLRRSPQVKLVALYGPEHGIYGDSPAEFKVGNTIDKRTG